MYRFGFCTKADLIARLCDDAKKEAKIENGLEDIARLRWVVVRRSRKKKNEVMKTLFPVFIQFILDFLLQTYNATEIGKEMFIFPV